MSGVLERTLGILELLSGHPAGLPVGSIAARLTCRRAPRTGCSTTSRGSGTCGRIAPRATMR